MYPFTILAISDVAFESSLEIVMSSFAEFYHNLTPKHQKQLQLIFIDKGGYTIPALQWIEKLNIKHIAKILNWKRMEMIEEAYNNASFLLLPAVEKTYTGIVYALSKGLPVISYKGETQQELVDVTCGMLIDYVSVGQSIGDFASLLNLLYFDPAACKILKKGALKRYELISEKQLNARPIFSPILS